MATTTNPDDATDAYDAVDARHISGDIYFVNKYPRWMWYVGAALCVVPPAGAFVLAFFIFSGLHFDGEPVEVAAE